MLVKAYLLISTTTLLLFGALAFSQTETPKEALLYKTNKVKSEKVYEYKYKRGKVKGKGKLLLDYRYDTAGREVESYYYGNGEFHQTYKYNEKGDITEKIGYVLNSPVSTTFSYKYDGEGRMTEKVESGYGGKWNFYYDTAGNKIKTKWLLLGESRPESFFTDIFSYDGKRRLIKHVRHYANDSVYFYRTFEYDTAGNLTKEMRFERGEVTDTWENHYDSMGCRIEQRVYDHLQKKFVSSFRDVHDKNGLVSESFGKLPHKKKLYYRKSVYEYY